MNEPVQIALRASFLVSGQFTLGLVLSPATCREPEGLLHGGALVILRVILDSVELLLFVLLFVFLFLFQVLLPEKGLDAGNVFDPVTLVNEDIFIDFRGSLHLLLRFLALLLELFFDLVEFRFLFNLFLLDVCHNVRTIV